MIWLFPILFVFHDFEEIIFMKAWIGKKGHSLADRFPKIAQRMLPHFKKLTTASFALGVAEEFILVSVVTIISYLMKSYGFWTGLFIAFTLHLIMHCFQALIIKGYVPCVVTSIICLPVSIYIIKLMVGVLSMETLILYSVLGFIVMILNVTAVHIGMDRFDD